MVTGNWALWPDFRYLGNSRSIPYFDHTPISFGANNSIHSLPITHTHTHHVPAFYVNPAPSRTQVVPRCSRFGLKLLRAAKGESTQTELSMSKSQSSSLESPKRASNPSRPSYGLTRGPLESNRIEWKEREEESFTLHPPLQLAETANTPSSRRSTARRRVKPRVSAGRA